ncbi:hypothetical protein PISMIDRAFT_18122 [Pisolithus microcarpus 441]|uniref:Uncharacterized protein n=1 Tax=Pisolithus microcarpus 441 TaxID=765257 RepID=A0A0C9YZE2_9AGAM|nr:hypothetical protein PISMIDRAFT_18122 [Pisolithus microcarpus 441]
MSPITPASFSHPIVPSYPASSVGTANPPSTVSASTDITFNWQLDLSHSHTPTSFAPPSVPSSVAPSNISSIKPSSSISAHMENSRKWRADDKDNSIISGKTTALDNQIKKFGNLCETVSDNSNFVCRLVSVLETKTKDDKTSCPPLDSVVHQARQKLLEMDKDMVLANKLILIFQLFQDNSGYADGYLQLTDDPDLVTA